MTQPAIYRINSGEGLDWSTKLNLGLDALWAYMTSLSTQVSDWALEDNMLILVPYTCTYSDADTFVIAGVDFTSRMTAGKRVHIQVAAGLVTSTVASSSYGGGNTTVNLNNAVLTNPITCVYVVATRDGLFPFGQGFVNALDYGGGTPSRAALVAADAVAAATGKQLMIAPGAWALDIDVALASVSPKIMPGADLQVATTKTLTFTSAPEAKPYPIFSCTGTGKVVLPSTVIAYPQWWGTNVTASINAALASGAALVDLGAYIYAIATTVLWDISKCALIGSGAKLDATGNAGIALSVFNDSAAPYDYFTFSKWKSGGFELVGDRVTHAACVGIELGSATDKNTGNFYLQHVSVHNFHINLHFNPSAWAYNWFACSFDKMAIYNGDYGVKAVYGGERNYFKECVIHDNTHGFYVSQGDWTLDNCNVDYNHNRSLHTELAGRIEMKGGHLESNYDVDHWLYCTGGSSRIRLHGTSIVNTATATKTKEVGLADQCGAEGISLDAVTLAGFDDGTSVYGLDNLIKVTDYTGNVSCRGLLPFNSSTGLPTTNASRIMLAAHLNYLLDGGFETGFAVDWSASSGAGYTAPALDAAEKHSGAKSLKFAPTVGNQTQIMWYTPCRVGEWGRMTFWIKNSLATSVDVFRIEAGYLAADRSEVPYHSQVIDLSQAGTKYTTWTQLWLTPYYPAPAGAVAAYFKFKVGTGASDGNGQTWVDDVQINMWIQ